MKNIKAKIISIENSLGDYYSIKLKPLEEFSWKAGQFIVLRMLDSDTNNRDKRTLSIASSSEEEIILIGTRTGENISDFKKELLDKKTGDIVDIQGPMGNFVRRDTDSPMIIIAGGIGITPVRALVKSLENDRNCLVELIYSARNYHMYLEELEEISKKNNNINIYYTKNREETDDKLKVLVEKFGNSAYFYISGTEDMVKGIKEVLAENNIVKTRVVSDMMIGY